MDAQTWFSDLAEGLAGPRGGMVADPNEPITDEERDALLDLARLAAHGSERWTAPISTYLAGLALADVPAEQRGVVLRRLVTRLEENG